MTRTCRLVYSQPPTCQGKVSGRLQSSETRRGFSEIEARDFRLSCTTYVPVEMVYCRALFPQPCCLRQMPCSGPTLVCSRPTYCDQTEHQIFFRDPIEQKFRQSVAPLTHYRLPVCRWSFEKGGASRNKGVRKICRTKDSSGLAKS
jgi:hypothetical protein